MTLVAPYRPLADHALLAAWTDFFGHLPNADAQFDDVLATYRQPGRYYHTIEHGLEVAAAARRLCDALPGDVDRDLVCAAAWVHDAHYLPSATDNEQRSAELAERVCRGLGMAPSRAAGVRGLVLASAHKQEPATQGERVVCDADLSTFAKPWDEYLDDVANIRVELNVTDPAEWRSLRSMILDILDDRQPFYSLDESRAMWHADARANRDRERQQLLAAI